MTNYSEKLQALETPAPTVPASVLKQTTSQEVETALLLVGQLVQEDPHAPILELPNEQDDPDEPSLQEVSQVKAMASKSANDAVDPLAGGVDGAFAAPLPSPPVVVAPTTGSFWRLSEWKEQHLPMVTFDDLRFEVEEAIFSERIHGIEIKPPQENYSHDYALHQDDLSESFQREIRLKYGDLPTWEEVVEGKVDFWELLNKIKQFSQARD